MSRDYFFKDPEDFWLKYKEIFGLKLLKNFNPNDVHYFLKALEDSEKDVQIVTQNVDGLHQMAGNKHVIEYHGNLNTAKCPSCGTVYSLDHVMQEMVPRCKETGCGDVLKPGIVLFGDPITEHSEAEAAIAKSELLLVLGTSLLVSPFNMLPDFGVETCGITGGIINREPTPSDAIFDYVIHGELVEAVHQLQQEMEG